jgi:hypothetical protein
MSKKLKVTALLAVAALILAMPVFAQSSPTSMATAGVFSTDYDDFMSVHWYTGVETEGGVLFAGNEGRQPAAGYATRFGGLYLGAFYTGNIMGRTGSETREVRQSFNLPYARQTGESDETWFDGELNYRNNHISVLVGIIGMGFRLGFSEWAETINNPQGRSNSTTTTTDLDNNTVTVTKEVQDFSYVQGGMTPSFMWGMSLPIGSMTLRPYAGVDFTFIRNSGVYNSIDYWETDGKRLGVERLDIAGTNAGHMNPYFTVGVGLGLDNGMSFGLGYTLGLRIGSSNSYNEFGYSGNVDGSVSWEGFRNVTETYTTRRTETDLKLILSEISYMSHSIRPSFWMENEIADGLKLGFSIALPVDISSESTDMSTRTYNTVVLQNLDGSALNRTTLIVTETHNGTSDTSTMRIQANVGVGATYEVVPGRFSVNAGLMLRPVSLERSVTDFSQGSNKTTTTTKVYEGLNTNGNLVSTRTQSGDSDITTDRSTATNTLLGFYASPSAGFTVNFTPRMAFDAAWAFPFEEDGGSTAQVVFSFKF